MPLRATRDTVPANPAPGVPIEGEIKTLKIGEAELLQDGDDIAIIAIGAAVPRALDAAQSLAATGVRAAVLNARFVKPLDEDRIVELARRCARVLVVEEHTVHGGFGDAVLSLLASRGVTPPLRSLGVPDEVIEHGAPAEVLADLGLDAAGIERAARELLA